jgi:hypothetical protein
VTPRGADSPRGLILAKEPIDMAFNREALCHDAATLRGHSRSQHVDAKGAQCSRGRSCIARWEQQRAFDRADRL